MGKQEYRKNKLWTDNSELNNDLCIIINPSFITILNLSLLWMEQFCCMDEHTVCQSEQFCKGTSMLQHYSVLAVGQYMHVVQADHNRGQSRSYTF
jgi:hypothetical protein